MLILGDAPGREPARTGAVIGKMYASGEYHSREEVLSSPLSELLLLFILYGPANVQ
jgi:hypothetical protein